MKATLSFDLSEPDDHTRHLQCVKASDMAIALWRIHQLRYKEWESDDFEEAVRDILAEFDMEELCP